MGTPQTTETTGATGLQGYTFQNLQRKLQLLRNLAGNLYSMYKRVIAALLISRVIHRFNYILERKLRGVTKVVITSMPLS